MLRILIALPLALAIGGCAPNPSGYIGLGTQRPADVSVAEWRGDLVEPARRGVRDPKSPDTSRGVQPVKRVVDSGPKTQASARPPNPPASASRPEPPRTAGKAQALPSSDLRAPDAGNPQKPALKQAKPKSKTCRLRDRVWQGWRWVCP